MLATPGIPGMQDQSQEGFWATMHGSPQVSSPPPAHHLRSVLPDFTLLTAAFIWEAQDQGAASKTQPSSSGNLTGLTRQGLVGTGGKKPWLGPSHAVSHLGRLKLFSLDKHHGYPLDQSWSHQRQQAKLKPHLP